jgi:hypothetical protein
VDSGVGIAYRFNRNGVIVDVVWGGGRTNLPTAATKAQAFDMAGNTLPTDVSGGQIHVDIGGDPVFVEHTGALTSPPPPLQAPPINPITAPAAGPGNVPGLIGHK